MTTFPGVKHDDQVDSTTHALARHKGAGREPGLITYMKRQAAELQAP